MIRIAIVDDDKVFCPRIQKSVSNAFIKYTDDFKIDMFYCGRELLNSFYVNKYDVLFIDIDMPVCSGFDVAEFLRNNYECCYIIFVTSHTELMHKSMDYQPFHFICKNSENTFDKNVEVIVSKLMTHMKQNIKLSIETEKMGRKIFYLRDLVYISSDNHNVIYHLKNESFSIRCKINDIQSEYQKYNLIRIHRSTIINMRYIERIDTHSGIVYLHLSDTNKIRLSMSRKYQSDVDKQYTMYLRSTL